MTNPLADVRFEIMQDLLDITIHAAKNQGINLDRLIKDVYEDIYDGKNFHQQPEYKMNAIDEFDESIARIKFL